MIFLSTLPIMKLSLEANKPHAARVSGRETCCFQLAWLFLVICFRMVESIYIHTLYMGMACM